MEFSGLLERDWCRARRDDLQHSHRQHGQRQGQGQNAVHGDGGTGNPGGGGSGGGVGAAAGTAGRRIENMGVLLEQLAPLLDWNSEVCVCGCVGVGMRGSWIDVAAMHMWLLAWVWLVMAVVLVLVF